MVQFQNTLDTLTRKLDYITEKFKQVEELSWKMDNLVKKVEHMEQLGWKLDSLAEKVKQAEGLGWKFDDLAEKAKHIEELGWKLDRLKEEFALNAEKLDQIEYRLLMGEEKDERDFDSASPITVADIRQLDPASVTELISCSYTYPIDKPLFLRFQYRHDRVAENEASKWGVVVYGSWRWFPEEKWDP